jgi:hypothetical protein
MSTSRPSKIYPNWDFGFENEPSGSTDLQIRESREKSFEKQKLFASSIFFSLSIEQLTRWGVQPRHLLTARCQGDQIGRIFAQWVIVYFTQ